MSLVKIQYMFFLFYSLKILDAMYKFKGLRAEMQLSGAPVVSNEAIAFYVQGGVRSMFLNTKYRLIQK